MGRKWFVATKKKKQGKIREAVQHICRRKGISKGTGHLLMSPLSSIGSPITLIMRPSVALPTGTYKEHHFQVRKQCATIDSRQWFQNS
jgi:hypothetical protein